MLDIKFKNIGVTFKIWRSEILEMFPFWGRAYLFCASWCMHTEGITSRFAASPFAGPTSSTCLDVNAPPKTYLTRAKHWFNQNHTICTPSPFWNIRTFQVIFFVGQGTVVVQRPPPQRTTNGSSSDIWGWNFGWKHPIYNLYLCVVYL